MSASRFGCPRTCALFASCRFSAVLSAVGPSRVTSHTVRVRCDYHANPEALSAAVAALGGTLLGAGTHRLYEDSHQGLGFRLPGWQYPLVARQDGTLAYDDYRGQWGDTSLLPRLQAAFAVAAARTAAEAVGWYCEETPTGLRVFHPDGGYMDVAGDGTVEAFGFEGVGCHGATDLLAAAIGRGTAEAKPEYFAERARVTRTGGAA